VNRWIASLSDSPLSSKVGKINKKNKKQSSRALSAARVLS
jgi:hypothetical protein